VPAVLIIAFGALLLSGYLASDRLIRVAPCGPVPVKKDADQTTPARGGIRHCRQVKY
jgi:hypothetical protein